MPPRRPPDKRGCVRRSLDINRIFSRRRPRFNCQALNFPVDPNEVIGVSYHLNSRCIYAVDLRRFRI
jgi:hypothetical protein